MTTPLPAVYTPDTVAAHLGVSERNGAGTPQGSRRKFDTAGSRDVRGDIEIKCSRVIISVDAESHA